MFLPGPSLDAYIMKKWMIIFTGMSLLSFGVSPSWALVRTCIPGPIAEDADQDCRLDADELNISPTSNPNFPDSDFDGLVDGDEIRPEVGTNPLNHDSDGDGLSDGFELELSLNQILALSPTQADTDGDGISDFQELTGSCGDQITNNPEQCDDGNLAAGDGCSPFCTFEICGNNILDAGEQCDDGGAFTGSADVCGAFCNLLLPVCQDGLINSPGEQCDNGPDAPGDGCSSLCQGQVCGNGVVDVDMGEQCDVGPDVPNDGCSEECRLEGLICGDGVRIFTEECDDGNSEAGDGCDSQCQIEIRCGDGIVQGSLAGGQETCDDGNDVAGDGCDAQCRSERCGDGIIQREGAVFEECDDGNSEDDDACDSLCQNNADFIEGDPSEGGAGGAADDVQGSGCALAPGARQALAYGLLPIFVGLTVMVLRRSRP